MTIIHIAEIDKNMFRGVCVVVPQHVQAQQKIEEVGFINIKNIEIEGVDHQFQYKKPFSLNDLPEKFKKPDLVVFHDVYRVAFLQIAKNLRKNKIPYMIVPHGCLTQEAQSMKRWKKLIGNMLFFNKFIKNAVAIQCLSQKELETTHFKVKKFIGTNGICTPQNKKERFHQEEIKIVYIGRLDMHIKGLDLMLEAVKQSRKIFEENNIKLYMYGPDLFGRYANLQQMITDKNVQDLVLLNHEIVGKNKVHALLDADVFIQASRSEGMPMGILEALSYGLPCLVTRGTTLGEMIEEYNAGWMAETNVESIAKTIERAVKEKTEFGNKSENAKKLIQENFVWDKIADKTVNLYRKTL